MKVYPMDDSPSSFAGGFALLRLLCLVALSFLLTQTVPAQYRFDNWTTDNGLPQNGVRGIGQTPDGYLWVTTFDGLVRFDGAEFTVFDKNNSQGISSNRFAVLHIEKDGTVLAGTEDGFLTVYRNGKFRSFGRAEGLQTEAVWDFLVDTHGETFLATETGNYYFRGDHFVSVPDANAPNQGRYYLGPTGSLWLFGPNGVRQLTPDKRETIYPVKFDIEDHWRRMKLFEDSHGYLWTGDRSAVYRLKDGEIKKFNAAAGVPPQTILRPWVEDSDGSIWFASAWEGRGAFRYSNGKFENWDKSEGLAADTVDKFFKDREGTIWVVPTDRGLSRLQKQFVQSISTGGGLVYQEAYPIIQTSKGDVYVGTTRGLSRRTPEGRFTDALVKNAAGVTVSGTALWEDERGRLWVGSGGGDLFVLENGKPRTIKIGDNATVWTIQNDRAGNIWIGTDKGLLRCRDDQIVERFTTRDGLPSNDIKIIHQDRNGNLWLGTYGGLAQMKSNGTGTRPTFLNYTIKEGLASDRVRTIHEDEAGTLWIGTYDGGLSRFRDGHFFNYTIRNGLFNNGVFAILPDDRGQFWISCNRGVYRVNRQELEDVAAGRLPKINSVAYGKQDGMLSTECNGGRQPAGIKTKDGKLWFPTQDGVVIVNPREVTFNPQPPPVQIASVLVETRPLDFQNGIVLGAGDHSLDIKYTGISFIKTDQIRFRYLVEGLNETWTEVGTVREVHFPSLPAGVYTFHVQAANSDGVWNTDGARLRIRVLAPFWRQGWFIALAVLAAFAIAFCLIRWRERELRRRQLAQQEFSRRLLESQEDERKRIASEMHDSLGQYLLAIKNWALFGLNSLQGENPAREHLSEISETSSLALDEVREISHNLRPYQLERLGLTNALEYMLQHLKNVPIQFATEIENIDGLLSKEGEINFYRIVQECVNNIIKHSEAKNGWLIIKPQGNFVDLVCRDDGQGFEVSAAKNSPRSGLGMTGLAERARILGAEHRIESVPGIGTTIFVSAPVKRDQTKSQG
jgi:signal transduction histidine kinase/ligand-binding sensor domain-containing protein